MPDNQNRAKARQRKRERESGENVIGYKVGSYKHAKSSDGGGNVHDELLNDTCSLCGVCVI